MTGIGVDAGPAAASQVLNEHPEWLHTIVDVACRIIESSLSSKEDALLLLLIRIGDICTVIQATAHALAKLRVLRWGSAPCRDPSPHLGGDAGAGQLMQAIYQGVGAWNPAGALIVGLKQMLCPSAVRAQQASVPFNLGSGAQFCSVSQKAELEHDIEMGMAHPCANMRRVLEVSMD